MDSGMWLRHGSLQEHVCPGSGKSNPARESSSAWAFNMHRDPWILLAFATSCAAAMAADEMPATTLEPVVVTVQRERETAFAAPASISAVTRETLANAGPGVNLSEALRGVAGISALNRQNYAQDVQLSIRGFGARSAFGIRGVRLIVDGIPATMPDGQAQASSIDLGSAGRIEVLRGPLAQLYGNAAGGVVQVFTLDDTTVPTAFVDVSSGSFGLRRAATRLSSSGERWGATASASTFVTDGWRRHSAAERRQFNARLQADPTPELRASVVVNVLEQPRSLDPAGLTRAQWQSDPRSVAAIVEQQDARKSVRQTQIGTVEEWRLDSRTQATFRAYVGQRDLDNALSTPLAAQQPSTSSGGIVRLDRRYAGGGIVVSRRFAFDDGAALRLVGGVEADRMREYRQGYINELGQQGALKRDERNVVDDRDLFAQLAWDLGPRWTLLAGARRSSVRFSSHDHFITAGNPDDSGAVAYAATSPVAGLAWRPSSDVNVYANLGRGFETPTFTELAYRSNASGLNFNLAAAHSRHAELGIKWRAGAAHRVEAALFDIATHDELVVDSNDGGRTTYKNAGRTQRRGVEVAYAGQLAPSWRLTLSGSWLEARFRDGFSSGSGASASAVAVGNRLPGAPEHNAYAELAWAPRAPWAGFNTALEVVHSGRIWTSDGNDDKAPAATVYNLRAGLAQQAGHWRFEQRLRLDNATDKRYTGSVIVGDANKRYFEPALPRSWLLALSASYAFE
ncbi:MAG: TonB-dependent receptor [Pseudomonadota bacterium]|nr:TonB-dependent receptor [Pseudomonadota bacterium]